MTKLHPTAVEGSRDLREKHGLSDYVKDLIVRVGSDRDAALPWMERRAEFYDRRFGRYAKNVTYPWIGASDTTIQLEDIHVEEFKPSIMSLTFGGPRIFTMVPQNADAIPYAVNASRVMQSLHMGAGVHSMPDFLMQTAYSIESLGQHGLCIDKTYYHYETRQTTETIRKRDMPAILANFVVDKSPTPQEIEFAATIGVVLMSKRDFDARAEEIKALVAREYGLDKDDKIDKVACAQIMDFLRNGQQDSKILVKRRAIIRDCPRTVNVPIEDIIVPQGTISIDCAERVTHRMFFSETDLRQRAHDEVWNPKAVEDALGSGEAKGNAGVRSNNDDVLYQARIARHQSPEAYGGGWSSGSPQFEIWECYDTWDIDGDGLDERVVLTIEPKSGVVLRAMELPFDNGEWPFTSTFFEATDQSYFGSRGIPEKIAEPAAAVTAYARAEENGLTLQTAQTFTLVKDSGLNPQSLVFMPGLIIPVNNHNDLQAVQMSPTALALEQPMRGMMQLAERIVTGSNRAVIDSPPPERRTKGEIDFIDSAQKKILGVRGHLWNHGMRRKGQLAWDLWKQYGPGEWEVYLTGESPVKMTQAQIRGGFLAAPAGAVADMDPEYRKNKALTILQMTMQAVQQFGDDPRYVPDGMQAFVNAMEEYDPVTARSIIHRRSPEEIQQLVEGRQAQAQAMQKMQMEAQKMLENGPTNLADARRIVAEIQKDSPHKGLQNIIVAGMQARKNVERDAALVGGPPA